MIVMAFLNCLGVALFIRLWCGFFHPAPKGFQTMDFLITEICLFFTAFTFQHLQRYTSVFLVWKILVFTEKAAAADFHQLLRLSFFTTHKAGSLINASDPCIIFKALLLASTFLVILSEQEPAFSESCSIINF